jgi:hypothetical protein
MLQMVSHLNEVMGIWYLLTDCRLILIRCASSSCVIFKIARLTLMLYWLISYVDRENHL